MSARENERDQQHMLHLVESAQRAGYSEIEVEEMITNAREADAELETRPRLRLVH